MITSCTFIPNKNIYDLLCALWAEYRLRGNTRVLLMSLRAELGADEFARFERDMARLLEKHSACFSVQMILAAAIRRSYEHSAAAVFALQMQERREKELRTTYQPA